MPTPLTPAERYLVLRGIDSHVTHLFDAARNDERSYGATNVDHEFVRQRIADACAQIDRVLSDPRGENLT